MDERLRVFNQYKSRKFQSIQKEVSKSLMNSYNIEKENWDALDDWERATWENFKGNYGAWWHDYLDSPYDGVYEYINELMDRHWNWDEVLNITLNANVGLDPKTIYDELVNLVFGTMDTIAELNGGVYQYIDKFNWDEVFKAKKSTTTIFINWNENPFEV